MRNIYYKIICCLAFALFLIATNQKLKSKTSINPVPGSCTIFSASVGDKAFYGNNEDYYKSETYLWTNVAKDENYGCIYLGFEDYSHQGGINEKGLCFDANALPKSTIKLHLELASPPHYEAPYDEYMMWLPVLILRKAATVKEAVEIAKKYQRKNWYPKDGKVKYQLNFADATGDAVIISVDEYGELVYTKKENGENYLLSTNFNRANPKNAFEYPCKRYNKAEEMLGVIKNENDLTPDYFKAILESVHQKGVFNRTLYSNIFDLKNGIVYLYHWHQFEEVVVLNVEQELAKEEYVVRIKDLFSQKTVNKASNGFAKSILLLCLKIMAGTIIIAGLIYLIKKNKLNTAGNNAHKDQSS
ncbi:hypothetical protein [Lewinella sp. LCG006]|uniref:hypothetical protein n=1 Tax=Lewinella sp. LCG006 TaxID=3231911 RepID=UPI003460FAD4